MLDFAQQEGKGREVAGIPGGCVSGERADEDLAKVGAANAK